MGSSDTDPALHRQSAGVQATPASAARTPAPAVTPAAALPRPTLPEIYEAHFGTVWNTLKRLGVWERDLEDAAHDVFLVVHRRLADYDETRPIKPWLAGIAARVASEFRRRAQHRREVVSDTVDEHAPDLAPAADAALDDKRRRELVLRGLERLDFERRTVLVLHDIEGHSMPEIAAALEENINTLYARLRAARQQFAAAVVALKGGAS